MRTTDGSGLALTRAAQRNLRQAACSVGLDPSYWYPVELDSSLRREQVIGIKFQNTSVAVFRDRDGDVHAIEDRCAHRGVKLSHGFVEDCNIRCVYHGWTYSPDGKLCHIEHELFGKSFPSVRLRTFPVQVRYGLIWVFFGDRVLSNIRHVPDIPELESQRPWVCIRRMQVWKAHPTMIVNNFIDSTHVDTLHNRSFWTRALKIGAITGCVANSDRVLVTQKVEMDTTGLLRHAGPVLKTNIEHACYEYPYLWARVGEAYQLWTLMLPIDNQTTKVFQLSLCDRVRIPFTPWLAPHRLQRFITPFCARFLVDPLLDADAASAEMEQEGYEAGPGLAPVDPHPATNLCYQLTLRKWREHIAED
jgi:nitrite reductase/ring-hydroxylating ferredoxin subunit